MPQATPGLYRGYPDMSKTLDAGKEMVRLIRNGETFADQKHTFAIGDTISGGLLAFYPGAPQAQVGSLSAGDTSSLDTLRKELEGNKLQIENSQKVGGQLNAAAGFDIGTWIQVVTTILELIKKIRGG